MIAICWKLVQNSSCVHRGSATRNISSAKLQCIIVDLKRHTPLTRPKRKRNAAWDWTPKVNKRNDGSETMQCAARPHNFGNDVNTTEGEREEKSPSVIKPSESGRFVWRGSWRPARTSPQRVVGCKQTRIAGPFPCTQ